MGRSYKNENFSTIQNERGISTLAMLSSLTLPFMLIMTSMASTVQQQISIDQRLVKQVVKNRMQSELETIFSYPDVCTRLMRFGTTNNFWLNNYMKKDAQDFRYGSQTINITDMAIENPTAPDADGMQTADFVVQGHFSNESDDNVKILSKLKLQYKVSAVDPVKAETCSLVVDAQTACQSIGANWNAAENRCEICEMTGGSWSGGTCTF